MKPINLLLFLISAGFAVTTMLSGCYKHNVEELYPLEACDTVLVSYSAIIEPLIRENCYDCHNSVNYKSNGGNLLLEGYSNLFVVIPDGTLLSSVSQDGKTSRMPRNAPKLDDCTILKIKEWLDQGFPNN